MPRASAHCSALAIAMRIALPSSLPSSSSALAIAIAFARTGGDSRSMEGGKYLGVQGMTDFRFPGSLVPSLFSGIRGRPSSVNQKHRDGGVANHEFGVAAHEHPLHSAASMGSHHDQIGAPALRPLDDHVRNPPAVVLQQLGLRPDAPGQSELARLSEKPFAAALQGFR